MRTLVLSLVILLISCTPIAEEAAPELASDSLKHVFLQKIIKEKDSLKLLYDLHLLDSSEYAKVVAMEEAIDSMNFKALKSNLELRDLEDLEETFKGIVSVRRVINDSLNILQAKLDSANELNSELSENNKSLKKNWIKERNNSYRLKSKASKLQMTNINITGIAYKPLTNKLYRTNRASKISKVAVDFTIPANDMARVGPKRVGITIYSTDNKTFISIEDTIEYFGNERNYHFYLDENKFDIGPHKVIITLEGAKEYKTKFNVLK